MLDRAPAIKGISLPGMPAGSPGMFGEKTEPFTIYEISEGIPKALRGGATPPRAPPPLPAARPLPPRPPLAPGAAPGCAAAGGGGWSESASMTRQSRTLPPAHCSSMRSSSLLSIVSRASRRSTCSASAAQADRSHRTAGRDAERRMPRRDRLLPGRQIRLRGRYRERRYRGEAIHRCDRHVRPGRRGGGGLFEELAPGQRPDQWYAPGRDRHSLQRPLARHGIRRSHELERLRRIRVISPPGRVTNVDYPGPLVAGIIETHPRLANITIAAMGKYVPERAMASESCTGTNFVFGGNHPDHDEYFACYDLLSGGWGRPLRPRRQRLRDRCQRQLPLQSVRVLRARFFLLVEECADHRFKRLSSGAYELPRHPHRSRSPAFRSQAASV